MPQNRLIHLPLCLASLLFACHTAPKEGVVIAPLTANDFAAPVDKELLRTSNPDLSDASFDAKWLSAKDDAEGLFRSFPGAFYLDFSKVAPERIPGGEAVCVGDPHTGNFGYLHVNGQTVYGVNDFDDSGYCPAALDAVRYLTVLRLGGRDLLISPLVELFTRVVRDPAAAQTLDPTWNPAWDTILSKGMARITMGDQINLAADTSLSAPTPEDRAEITAQLTAAKQTRDLKVLDVAAYARVGGGSGGLDRYWVLAILGNGTRTLLELKQAGKAGVELGPRTRVLATEERLAVLEQAFWSAVSDSDYFYVTVKGKTFLVRNKLGSASFNWDKLSDEERDQVLRVQTSLLAKSAGPGLADVPDEQLIPWLLESSQSLAARWREATKLP